MMYVVCWHVCLYRCLGLQMCLGVPNYNFGDLSLFRHDGTVVLNFVKIVSKNYLIFYRELPYRVDCIYDDVATVVGDKLLYDVGVSNYNSVDLGT